MDFTLRKYDSLCRAIAQTGYVSLQMSEYMQAMRAGGIQAPLSAGQDALKVILLRHDVDSHPFHAQEMATIERHYDLTATYFFRTIPSAFNPAAIQAIHAMGHEVGYHYETLAQAGGDVPRAIELFRVNLEKMRQIAPIKVASMHGSPLSRWDNRGIWLHTTPAAFDLVGEAYRDIDYNQIIYLNDTGRTWNPTRYNLRDVTENTPPALAESTDDLIRVIRAGNLPQLCLSAHPERWQDNRLAWVRQATWDVFTNGVKIVLKKLYGVTVNPRFPFKG